MVLREFLYKTLIHLVISRLSGQKIIKIAVVLLQAKALKETLPLDSNPLISGILQSKVEVCSAANILVRIKAVIPVRLIQSRGAFLILRSDIAFILNEMSEPVSLGAVFIDGFLYAGRDRIL